jgi:hypothetical protein
MFGIPASLTNKHFILSAKKGIPVRVNALDYLSDKLF